MRFAIGLLVLAGCGRLNFDSQTSPTTVDASAEPVCGNMIAESGEVCDDGNQVSGDGCSADCLLAGTCGDGTIDVGAGETCDDMNTVGGDGCSATCQLNEMCGDGGLDGGEQCDTGPINSVVCDRDCTFAMCGDGLLNTAANEECDDGNVITTDACPVSCAVARCSDGYIYAGVEQCDDGNTNTSDACPACQNAVCGDGYVRAGVEECDSGPNNGMPGMCNASCSGTVAPG